MSTLFLAAGAFGRLYLEVIYVTVFAIGFIGLALSLMFGSHDAEHDVDHDHDTDHDHEGSGPGHASFLSLKVIWCFLIGGGAGGYFGAFAGWGGLGSFLCLLLVGLIMAAAGWWLLNEFYRGQSSMTVQSTTLVGTVGTVETTIPAEGTGRVQFSTAGGTIVMLAESTNRELFTEGTRVRVTDVISTTCFVVRA